jgi:hypothetical protein
MCQSDDRTDSTDTCGQSVDMPTCGYGFLLWTESGHVYLWIWIFAVDREWTCLPVDMDCCCAARSACTAVLNSLGFCNIYKHKWLFSSHLLIIHPIKKFWSFIHGLYISIKNKTAMYWITSNFLNMLKLLKPDKPSRQFVRMQLNSFKLWIQVWNEQYHTKNISKLNNKTDQNH